MTPDSVAQQTGYWWVVQYGLAGVLAGVTIEAIRRFLDRPRLEVRIGSTRFAGDGTRREVMEVIVENRGATGTLLHRSAKLRARTAEGREEHRIRIQDEDTTVPAHGRRRFRAAWRGERGDRLFLREYRFGYSGRRFPAVVRALAYEPNHVARWRWWGARLYFWWAGRPWEPSQECSVPVDKLFEDEKRREYGESDARCDLQRGGVRGG